MNAGANTARRKGAFTLIELLVVIAIIALLVSILVPSLSAAREIARKAVCMTHLKSMGFGVNMYANDNFEAIPPWRYQFSSPDYTWGWCEFFIGYVDPDARPCKAGALVSTFPFRVFNQPANGVYFGTSGGVQYVMSKMMNCPSQKRVGGPHYMMKRTWDAVRGRVPFIDPNSVKKITNYKVPNSGSAEFKSNTKGYNPTQIGLIFERPTTDPNVSLDAAGWDSVQWPSSITWWVPYRMAHLRLTCSNMLMVDGHVTSWTQADLAARMSPLEAPFAPSP